MNRVTVIAIAAAIALSASLSATPQTISPAEKAGAEAVADFLARGPVAFYERLASDAPLRLLNRTAALQEIETRAGEPAGANWVMRTARSGAVFEVNFPSGVDDLVMLDMKQEGAQWKIAAIRTLAETPDDQRNAPAAPQKPAAPASGAPKGSKLRTQIGVFAIAALLLSMIGAATRRTMRVASTFALTLAALSFCAEVVLMVNPGALWQAKQIAITRHRAVPFAELRPLLEFRRAVTRGDALPPTADVNQELSGIVRMWKAQAAEHGEMVEIPAQSAAPLFDLLHARSAADQGELKEAQTYYASLRSHIPSSDAFWMEEQMAQPEPEDPRIVRMMRFDGSRDAGTFYMQTIARIASGDTENAREWFRLAWRMQPMTRPDVVRAGWFAPLLHDPMISILVNLNAPEEARTADVELGRTPIHIPPQAKASASGTFVRISIDKQTLDIPGGADIAPRDTEVVPATEWSRRATEQALGDFEQLSKSHLVTPASRLRAQKTAKALERHHRWNDVLTLTDSIQVDAETVPLPLLASRVHALIRLHRIEEARKLAMSPAIGRSMQRGGADVGTLMDLAALLTEAGAYDDAIETYKRVESAKNAPDVAPRVRQVDLRRSLAASSPTATTEHFEIHSMPDVPLTVPERVGQLLEAELTRLTGRVTLPQFRRVRVNILNWTDFALKLTGSFDVLGFYDGDITIPFGTVAQFREQVVAILTHELTHAIVAQASDDNAPNWFQEGLARRMEFVQRQENIFQHRTVQQIPSIEVLDAQLDAFADPEAVSDAYETAGTMIRFLEDRYGPDTINGLIVAYRSGADTGQAFEQVTKKKGVDIDREFREWGATHTTAFLDNSPWPYTQFYSLGIDPKIRDAIRWSKPRKQQ